MSIECRRLILDTIRKSGPLTFARFMEIALYDPEVGYYARAARRSGRSGDFYTSVDVSPLFGELLAEQVAEMARLILERSDVRTPASGRRAEPRHKEKTHAGASPKPKAEAARQSAGAGPKADRQRAGSELQFGGDRMFDLVEAGAGNGRLSRDVLEALDRLAPDVYAAARLRLVERSAAARAAQPEILGRHAVKLVASGADLPASVRGIIFANELLDALPTHVVVGRKDGVDEVVIDAHGDDLVEREAPLSTPEISEYLARLQVRLPAGFRAEINLGAVQWVRRAARTLDRGFLLLLDYGHEAATLYSASHANGTLATFTGHVVETRDANRPLSWLRNPGDSDITAHVDFTSIRRAAESEGLEHGCLVDQMHFLMGLGIESHVDAPAGSERDQVVRRLALKALLVPGGLGTTHHVMVFSKKMGQPSLRGCSLARPWRRDARTDPVSRADPRD